MASKPAKFIFNGEEVTLEIEASIKREELYGKKVKQIEKDSEILQKGVLTQDGHLFPAKVFSTVRVDDEGTITEPTQQVTEDGSQLTVYTSSFKEAREITKCSDKEAAELCVDSVMPVKTSLDPGTYSTKFTYRDGTNLQDAVLIVKEKDAFLLTGEKKNTPMLGKGEVYEFFDEGDSELQSEDEEMDFTMF